MGELDAWGIIHEAQRQECYLRIRKNRRLDPFSLAFGKLLISASPEEL